LTSESNPIAGSERARRWLTRGFGLRAVHAWDAHARTWGQILGIARNSLRKKIRLLGITIDRVVGGGEADPEADEDE
jgi:hypothetical protein